MYDSLSLFTSYYRISDFEQPLLFASRPSYPIVSETLGILTPFGQPFQPYSPPPTPSRLYTHLRITFFLESPYH